jgi:arsenate reductase
MVELRNILYLCTGNSARSILAEAITNRIGRGRVRAFSAGSHPAGRVNPHAIELLIDLGYETASLRSKSWQEFAEPGAPQIDLIITLCDEAAGESCPVWAGKPLTAHWGVQDPAAAANPRAMRAALADAYRVIEARVHRLFDVPFSALGQAELRHRLRDIGEDRLLVQSFTL